jgi:polyhydroxybutyrate depolymerase
MRERMMARSGLVLPRQLASGTIDIDGHARTYSLAPAARAGAPLLLVLHGAGGAGIGMAALTGLAERAPAAGFAAVFPDGYGRVWNDERTAPRLARRAGIDDAAFLQALVERLTVDGVAARGAVFAVGMSNGSLLAEHLAHHDRLRFVGLALVAGPATVTSRAAAPRPARPTGVLVFHGTADPLVPYAGGPIGLGLLGGRARRREGGGTGRAAGRGLAAPVETVAADWAAVNGCAADPVVEPLTPVAGDLAVTRLTWSAPGRAPVIVHRVEGGGHTWPGGAQYLPPRVVGAVAHALDATGIILERFSRWSPATPEPPGPR